MGLIAGIDIGNATTEVALAQAGATPASEFLSSSIIPTTGIKGTSANIQGVFQALTVALQNAGRSLDEVTRIRINEAAPVIGDVAMETITETIITESTMIGHNPATPGGLGIGVGTTIPLSELAVATPGRYIVVADRSHDFEEVAAAINAAADRVQLTDRKSVV